MKERLERLDFGALALLNKFVEHIYECTLTVEVVEVVCEALRSIVEVRLSHIKHVGSICRLGVSILASGDRNSRYDAELERRLRSVLFCVLSERLLLSFKKTHRIEDCSQHIKALDSLISVLKSGQRNSGLCTPVSNALVQKLCRTGLKNGIHDTLGEDRIELGGRLLKFVRLLIRISRDETAPAFSEDLVKPSDIFSMATSHSKFGAMMSRRRSGDKKDDDRLALVLLMQTCIELSPSNISVEPHVWKLLCSANFGGLDKLDTAIVRFGDLCSTSVGDFVALPFLDEVRGLGGEHGSSREGRRWDWLLDGLDPNRIQETISYFPVGDSIGTMIENHALDQGSPAVVSDIDDENHVTSDRVNTESNRRFNQGDAMVTSVTRDRKYHQRYSPAFILPLLLGALHSCAPDEGVQEPRNEVLPASANSFSPLASMARRMCDKGVLGLCLASLASRCQKVRAFSVSILGLLLKGCNSEEARAIASWRERPQLVMLLSSLRRAFVLERGKLSSNGADIPILPTLVATFLARSSQSISKPDDPMYVPLNRYFLKSETEHGAFQDMSRLPGFIALYCSSGDDPIQSRKERIWALNHIRDGFLDPDSYRLVVSCHAPELLLTSLENIRLSSFSDEMKTAEYILVFDTIKTFIVAGGLRAASHLIDKIGLLSWICSLCTSRPVSETFPIDSVRVKILDLIEAAMYAVCGNTVLQRPTVIHECCKLLLPVIQLSRASSLDTHRISKAWKAAVRSLMSISKVVQVVSAFEGSQIQFQHGSGLDLVHAMTFLKNMPADLLRDGIFNICQLPYDMDGRQSCVESAGEFCCFVLEWQASMNGQKGQSPVSVLRRIIHIVSQFGGDLGEERNLSMVRTLLSSRSLYQTTDEDSCLWIKCLELLSLHLVDGTIEAELSAGVLSHACRHACRQA
jgi:Nucleolar pre-ribosomal-associated protein 1